MTISCAADSNVGLVRTNNEDSFLIDEGLGLFIVCDGMGGHKAGEVASQTACEILKREAIELTPLVERFKKTGLNADAKEIKKAVETAVQTACREIYSRASKDSNLTGMGTTCSMVLLIGHNKGVLGHVGDSRLYMVRRKKLYQLSEDHTYVNELVKRGALTAEQAEHHPTNQKVHLNHYLPNCLAADHPKTQIVWFVWHYLFYLQLARVPRPSEYSP